MISLLLTLILSFALDLCNNKDIILILDYNYNLYNYIYTVTNIHDEISMNVFCMWLAVVFIIKLQC